MIKTIDKEVGKLQFGVREKAGTREAIFVLRILMVGSTQVQKDVYRCFNDYKKAFGKVQHENIIETLNKYQLGKEYLQSIRHFY